MTCGTPAARWLLGTAAVLLLAPALLVAVPLSAVLLQARGSGAAERVAVLLVPLAVGVPVLLGLLSRLRRAERRRRAWLLAGCGVAVAAAASALPLSLLAATVHDQWQETQPGGRGYHDPQKG